MDYTSPMGQATTDARLLIQDLVGVVKAGDVFGAAEVIMCIVIIYY